MSTGLLVYVKSPMRQDTIPVELPPDGTVEDLRREFARLTDTSVTGERALGIFFGGEMLSLTDTLADCGVGQESCVTAAQYVGEPRATGRCVELSESVYPLRKIAVAASPASLVSGLIQAAPRAVEFKCQGQSTVRVGINWITVPQQNVVGAALAAHYRASVGVIFVYDPHDEDSVSFVSAQLADVGDHAFTDGPGRYPAIVCRIRRLVEDEAPTHPPQSISRRWSNAVAGRNLFDIVAAEDPSMASAEELERTRLCALGLADHLLGLADSRGMIPRSEPKNVEYRSSTHSSRMRNCTVQ